ncbi:MAG: hypothetical protein AB1656_20525 [Candidatus Omnitrophota bacterium]
MSQSKRLGQALIDSGVIDSRQLDEALAVQKEHSHRTLGEIVSSSYAVPMEMIETVFVKDILVPSVKHMLADHLKMEEEKFTQALPIKANQLVYDIEIISTKFRRTISTHFIREEGSDFPLKLHNRYATTDMEGILKIAISSASGETICQENYVSFRYDFGDKSARFEGGDLSGIQFRFSRAIAERLGKVLTYKPISEQELDDVLSQL